MSAASDITRKAKSNLAFALKILPRERRDDMVVFYAFCRTMDDYADDTTLPADQREALLESWKKGLISGFDAPDDFQRDVISLRDRHQIPTDLLVAIIDGCLMDLRPQRFQTWEDLSGYIWKVACAVGLVSVRLFGCVDPASEKYAVALGHALQLTNILRDISEDLENGRRIYLPLADLEKFGYSEEDLFSRIHDDRFVALMDFESRRTEDFYAEAAAALPVSDHRALIAARVMGAIYHLLLRRMRQDGFQVFKKRYQISKGRKLAILSKHFIS